MIGIGAIGPPETVKCSNQIFAVFEPMIRQRGEAL
jgi:hypothetical protein